MQKSRPRGRPAHAQPDSAGVFARNLRALRKARGWTQARLAGEAGVNVRSVSSYESGADVYVSVAAKFAEVFGVTVDALISENLQENSD